MSDEQDKFVGLEDAEAFEQSLTEQEGRAHGSTVMMQAGAAEEKAIEPLASPGQPGWAGRTLGHFRLLGLIGNGTMGVVIQAMDVHLRRIVALKVLRKRIVGFTEQQRVEQFLREARAAARIEHPNVVRIHEINQHGGWWYIAMEMVEGGNLKRIVKAVGALPPQHACPLIADAAMALETSHALGIIHRDVKPTNLLVTRGGRCKVTDFGLVRLDDPDDPFDFTDRAVGTPHFASPELIRQRQATPASDVYSLGATLYFALTGRPPYGGANMAEVLQQHLSSAPPDVRRYRPDCPATLSLLVQRTLAKEPADRPTAEDFAAALHVEAVGWREDSGMIPLSGSTLLGFPGRKFQMGLPAADVAPPPAAKRRRTQQHGPARILRNVLLALVAGMGLAACAVGLATGGRSGSSILRPSAEAVLAGRFPDAPESYGVLPAGERPAPAPLVKAPPFSWHGKTDVTGLQFVASKRGKHYWRIADANAMLIRADEFAGYRTESDARADGKTPAE
jgi:serine/threonine-protein kinase